MRKQRRASADLSSSYSASLNNSFADSLGLSNLDELAAKIEEQKRHEKLTHLSPFWARKQAAAAAAAASAARSAASGSSVDAPTRRLSTRRGASDDLQAELKNLKELTRDVPSQER